MKEKLSLKKILTIFVIVYLPVFSFGIFGPSEIYFANIMDFGIIYSEFGWKFLGIGTLLAIVITAILLFLPEKVQKSVAAVLWIISIGGYIQTMFLNKGIDSAGMTNEGYIPTTAESVRSLIGWVIVLVVCVVILFVTKTKGMIVMALTSFILLATQGVAYGTLFINASDNAFAYPKGETVLDASEEFTVSAEENVIVFILDTVSNAFYDQTFTSYPEEMKAPMKDFTYYANCDCNYWGTYPSVAHMLTGNFLDTDASCADWIRTSWETEKSHEFYEGLHANNYEVRYYTSDDWIIHLGSDLNITDYALDNLTVSGDEKIVDYPRIYKTMLKVSAYRFMPNILKPRFDVPNTAYIGLATDKENTVAYENPDFYEGLTTKKLSTKQGTKMLTYYHLNGIHEFTTSPECKAIPVSEGSIDGCMLGMWTMLGEYFDQLKELGVYDSSTIIVTADHGNQYDTQVIFFMKEANKTQEAMNVNRAPISLHELMPTIAQNVGLDTSNLGKTIYDFSEGESRERSVTMRGWDDSYPTVVSYMTGAPIGDCNVWQTYTYTGDRYAYSHEWEYQIFTVKPMKDYV